MARYYTIGEIFRLGLLLNRNGRPYGDKTTISRALVDYPHKVIKTPHGPGKGYTKTQINTFNRR